MSSPLHLLLLLPPSLGQGFYMTSMETLPAPSPAGVTREGGQLTIQATSSQGWDLCTLSLNREQLCRRSPGSTACEEQEYPASRILGNTSHLASPSYHLTPVNSHL